MTSRHGKTWIATDYRAIVRLWPDIPAIANSIGRTESAVRSVANQLGHHLKAGYTPHPKVWTAIATEEANSDGLDPVALLAGAVRKGYPEARRRAWRRVAFP